MSGQLPTNTGFDPTTIEGKGGIAVSGAGNVVVANGGPDGAGATIQELADIFVTRPTILSAPVNTYVTLIALPITTGPLGKKLHVQATLSGALLINDEATTFIRGGLRVLIDGFGPTIGATASGFPVPGARTSVSLAVQNALVIVPPVPPATTVLHTVELQWAIFTDGVNPANQFIIDTVSQDGASLIARELS